MSRFWPRWMFVCGRGGKTDEGVRRHDVRKAGCKSRALHVHVDGRGDGARVGNFTGRRAIGIPRLGAGKGPLMRLAPPPNPGKIPLFVALGGAFRGPAAPDRASSATARISGSAKVYILAPIGSWGDSDGEKPEGYGGKMALQHDVLRLAELDQKIGQFITERKTKELSRALTEYVGLRESLQRKTLDEDWLLIEDARARDVLRRISSGEGLEADDFVRAWGQVKGNSELAAFGELSDAEVEELGLDLFYSWYSHHEYVRALDDLRPLILQCDASPTVKRLVGKAKQCYAFQQYDATVVMCRVLLEASAHDIGGRLGLARRKVGSDWKRVCDEVLSGSESLERSKNIYNRFSKVAHAEREATFQEALNAFHETLSALEELYGRLDAN